jgi:hypothetical protein
MLIPLRRPVAALTFSILVFCHSSVYAQNHNRFADTVDHQKLAADDHPRSDSAEIVIPGPLRSFLRMAGISQKVSSEEILPLVARNVYVQGYQGWQEGGRPTEFLILLGRYVNQAKELAALAGPDGMIRVASCDQAGALLKILGYRMRAACGQKDAWLITQDSERAFLTTDSGFPLPAFEDAIRHNTEFSYHYPQSRVSILFNESDWVGALKPGSRHASDLLDALIRHPLLARLYWGFSRLDPETRLSLKESVGLKKLLPFAGDLDFYGAQIQVRASHVQVPGDDKSEAAWKDLVGASPDSPAEFVPKLLSKDRGWLAAYFDSLARVNEQQQERFTEPQRLKAFYVAFRGSDLSMDAARPAFRLAPGLLLLLTRTQWDANGEPLVPGSLQVWSEILNQKSESKLVRNWGKRSAHWGRADDLLEAMFAFSRLDTDLSPLNMYLQFSELDSHRTPEHRLKPETIRLLAAKFGQFNEQYLTFSEFSELDDLAITSFVNTAETLDKIPNHTLRGNAMGTFQSVIGIWQILARQGQIPSEDLNSSWQAAVQSFAKVASPSQLFDAGRTSVVVVTQAAGGREAFSQSELMDILAGPAQSEPQARQVHAEIAREIRAVMDGQRLVALDTLFALGDALNRLSKGSHSEAGLVPLAGELREFQMPRPIFTSSERTEWAAGLYNNRHTDLQMQTDLTKVLKGPASPGQIEEARGQLVPFLRDTLVGLNYAYYDPPGSQLLRVNPLFVRSHDFSGETVSGVEGLWRAPQLFGAGSPAGGGAHFVGSLADLPFALSDAEQDFIAPENVQALIWREAVPSLLTDAIMPRWWGVSRAELHAVALYQSAGEELVKNAASDQELRTKVMAILSERMLPHRSSRLELALGAGDASAALDEITPADAFFLTAEFRRRFPKDTQAWGQTGQELDRICKEHPSELGLEQLSRDFGVPHRTLAQSYARELLNLKPFPAFSGYSSRLMAESWDSNNLYWARLADEMGYPPVVLNRLVPELTRRMVAKIFATDFEDWQALLRAMRETGEDFRKGKIAVLPATSAEARPSAMN